MIDNRKYIEKWEATYYYIKGFASGANLKNLHKSLAIAKQLHDGQMRKGGDPYIVHPLKVCSYLISLGIKDDVILSAALLHDIIEDCDISKDGHELITKYGLDKEIVDVVLKVSKFKGYNNDAYYDVIKSDIRALLVKLSDRANNISTMVGAFSNEKMKEYIKETEDYILPLISYAKKYYPDISGYVTTMKYQIVSVSETIIGMLELLEEKSKLKGENLNETN